MIYNMYIFNKQGTCLYYAEWQRRKLDMSTAEDQKLVFGLLFSMKQFVSKISPKPPIDGFHSFRTSGFKLHYYETPTGLRFVLNTDPGAGDMRETLKYIYSQIYVNYAVKNPAYKIGEPIFGELFDQAVQRYIRSSPSFSS